MKPDILQILYVEDSPQDFELLNELLKENLDFGISMDQVMLKEELIRALQSEKLYDIVLCDFKLPDFDAFGALEILKSFDADLPFICVSGSIGEETAIELLKKGATDYVLKDRPDRLPFAMKRAIREIQTRKEKKKAEADLRASEQKFRDIFFKHSAIKMIVDPEELKIVEANDAAGSFYGWSVSELKKMKMTDINLSWPEEELKRQFSLALTSDKFNYEVRHRKKDGSAVDVNVYASKLFIGEKTYLHLIVYDISERKRAQEQVKLLSRAVEHSSVSVVITDPNGDIEYVNPAFSKITGYSSEEVIGANPRILSSGTYPAEFYQNLWNTILAGNDWSGEFRNKRKNGELYWESAVISPILDSNHKISHFIAIKEDITERKRMLRELLKAKEKAEESDKLKTAFIQNISHEIRTPLNGILGFGEILANNELPAHSKMDMLRMVQQSSNRLMNTISDYLDMSMIFSGTLEVNLADFRLADLINAIYERVEILCSENTSIKFYTELPAGVEGAVLFSDAEIVRKILLKLIENAFKFTRKGSVVMGLKLLPGAIEFFVRDTGIGISPDRLERIFDIFAQEDYSITRGYEGSGLGLSIAKGLVQILGGKIHVSSEKGKGSEFSFTIPVKKQPEKVPDEISAKDAQAGRPKKKPLILIAEDDELNFIYMKTILEMNGYPVIRVANGAEAIELCKQKPEISMVLMDVKMPVINGLEATREIRKLRPELPVIASTAYAQTGDEHMVKEAGCLAYLEKPVKKEKLLEYIHKFLKE